jgi:hypothetical protein
MIHHEPQRPIHVTVRPTELGDRFVVVEVFPDRTESEPNRDYGRLDAAVSKAWTLAKKKMVPLVINIDPGRPQAAPFDRLERADV